MSSTLLASLALLLDWLSGEPRRYHPLAGFGQLANAVERRCNRPISSARWQYVRGVLALLLLVLPLPLLGWYLGGHLGWPVDLLLLWFSLGQRSLYDHLRPVASALARGDEALARQLAARVVSRDSGRMNVPAAALESTLENGQDAVFGALFWFLLAGGSGALLFRLVNTLDAMWGYKNARYRAFGWGAARLDDVLGFIPARLTALSYACLGNTTQALRCWREQAPLLDSPNAGPVMCAGAGALGLCLGGPAWYQGVYKSKPVFGCGRPPRGEDINRALRLVSQGVLLWLGVSALLEGALYGVAASGLLPGGWICR